MDWLIGYYLWIRAFHIMAVIAWMAGLFYLPRLYVYHVEQVATGTPTDALFQTMEEKLLRIIMNPAMITAWILGLALVLIPGVVQWDMVWPWTKLAGLAGMTWFHMWLARRRKAFVSGNNDLTGRQYRMMNEVPTLLMVLIVVSVVVKF
ncbi:protoporphyrinogen oxidase HemJ [Rhodobaculum claviforme]|uniref:Protoporphyrinogen IX oxidase n=1 Tax=Rhodobaculum claviforme TaxID=1549854 RepID=A0A934TK69_9RHOB|nr:protoporphyrinogen oxidase HemJ [Rhodobaculum claviforme]MBK5927036.1 TIGR00701 family protein [Rhodobaculum claviforme]